MQTFKDITDPILITGCARSGTSMTAGVISLCGAWGGEMTGATPYNKKGQFENNTIRNGMIKPFLRSMDVDPLGQKPLPNIDLVKLISTQAVIDWRMKVRHVMLMQGYQGGAWFYKGAKMCLIWPLWKRAFPNAKWVIVRRNTIDIVNSCMKTGFMRAYHRPAGWAKWVRQHKLRFLEMRDAGLDVFEIWPSKMIKGDFREAEKMIRGLDLDWNENVVKSFISPALWHEHSDVYTETAERV